MPNILRRLRVSEISSVDRGAGEGVRVMLTKRDAGGEKVAKGIVDIVKAALGFGGGSVADKLDGAGDALQKAVTAILADDKMEKSAKEAAVAKAFDDYAAHLDGAIPEAITDALAAAGITKEGRMADKEETEAERKVRLARDLAGNGEGPKEGEGDGTPTKKALTTADLPEDVQKRLAEFDTLKKNLETTSAALTDLLKVRDMDAFRKRAVEVGLPESEADTIAKARSGDAAGVDKLLDTIKALHAQVAEAGLFKEAGHRGGSGNGASADAELRAKAAELKKADPSLTDAVAYAKAYRDPANASIVKRIKTEETR